MKQFIEIGEVVTTQGLNGVLKVYPWADSPSLFEQLDCLYTDENGIDSLQVLQVRIQKNMVFLKIENVSSVEIARRLIGKTLYCKREAIPLPEGRYFVQDLIGLKVTDANSGAIYGTVAEITNTGASDVYHIKSENGEIFLFPAAQEFLEEINIEKGCITVKPIEGMFAKDEN